MMNSSSDGESPSSPTPVPDRLLLTAEQAAALFPFHFVFDRSMRVLQAGASLLKVCPGLIGCDLVAHFELDRPTIPFNFESVAERLDSLFLMKHPGSPLRLRGQMIRLTDHSIAYLCSPWSPEPGSIRALGLRFEDFPLHDSMPELVQVVQSQRQAMQDMQELTDRLRSQRQSLREANEQLRIRESEAQRLAMIAARTENCVIVADAEGRIEWVNESFLRLTGFTLEECRGQTPGALLQGPATDPATVIFMRERIRAGEGFKCEIVNYSKSGQKYWLSVEVQPILDSSGTVAGFMAIESDITIRKDWELRNALAYQVTRILTESLESQDAVEDVLKAVCDSLPCQFGALWRVDRSGEEILCENVWAHADLRDSEFEAAIRRARLRPGIGLPGAVWLSDSYVYLPDLDLPDATELSFTRSREAVRCGLKSGFAFPVRLSGQVRGVVELFSIHNDEPSPGMIETLTNLGNQLQQFLERREAEEQRGEILSLLDSTLESSAEGIMISDLEGEVLRVNRRWLELWNVPGELRQPLATGKIVQWINQQLEDPGARDRRREWLRQHPDESQTDVLRMNDGRVIEVLSTPHRMGGKTVGRVWTYRDITEHYLSQSIREELLATLNATLEATTDGILAVDLNDNIVTYNKRFVEMWGLPPEWLKQNGGAGLHQIAARQLIDAQSAFETMQRVREEPEEPTFEILYFRDGRVIERSSHAQYVRKRIIGRVWSHRDVTERWRADQALRESEERYRIVMESAADAIVTADEKGRIVFASRSAARLFGFPAEELSGMTLWRLVPPEFRTATALRDLLRKTWRQNMQGVEALALRQDGSRLPVEISLHRSRVGGKKFTTGVLRDISLRKAAEEQFRKAIDAAESANRAKSDFLANISHEIRTPLNSIVGLSEFLASTRLDAEQAEMLTSVRASSESLLHLINDLLDFSKIEAGQVDIDSVEFEAQALGEQVIEMVRLRAERKGLAIFFTIHPAFPPRLKGDANRIRQILINLMVNALKFTEQGSIKLHLEWEPTDASRVTLRFKVEDTGIGISEQVQARIFQKFYRVDSPVGRRAGGAGLGLSISMLLCEAMGGTLEVSSTTGKGSQFFFTLPVERADIDGMEGHVESRRALLLASPELVDVERAVLVSAGFEVEAFSSSSEAAAHLDAAEPFDFLVIDEQMEAPSDELRRLARHVSLGKGVRCLRLARSPARERKPLSLHGLFEDLDFPLTPGRVRKAVAELTLASTAPSIRREAALEASAIPVGGVSVLVVEDNPDSQFYVRRVLERAGHSVAVASLGVDAVATAREGGFDVILMDVMLPDMTGFEATRSIREQETLLALSRVPVVALTAHALKEYRTEAFAADMDDYVTKPARPDALLEAVKKWGFARATRRRGLETSTQPASRPIHASPVPSSVMAAAGATPPVGAPPPADAKRPDTDQVLVSEELADLIPGYLDSVKKQLALIQQQADAGQLADAARLAHNLKGTGSVYGFKLVTRGGKEIAQAAKAGNAAQVRALAIDLDLRLSNIQWSIEG